MKKTKAELMEFGKNLVKQIKHKKNPTITLPVRSLSNVGFDKKSKTLMLKDRVANRYFFNVAHAKKFLQTVEVASISKNLLNEEKHASLRDVFYMAKRTIPDTKINIVDEQNESLSPDEIILVRVDDAMKFMTGEEILGYAREHGVKIFDDGKKERYTDMGLKVCSFDYDYKIKEMPVTLVIKHPSNIVKLVRTASGKSVKVTLSHSLFTSENGLPKAVEVKDLKVGDPIAVPRRISVEAKYREIDLVKKLISNCPQNILSLITLKGDKKVLNKILKGINREDLRSFVTKNYNGSLSSTLGNWRRSAIPLRLVKDLNLNLERYYDELKVNCKGAKHSYKCLIPCNKDLAGIIGFLLSEGSHSQGKRGSRTISVSNKRKDLLSDFKDSFVKCFGDKPAGKINCHNDGTFGLNLGYDLLSYIFEFGLECKVSRAWDKFLPSFLFDAHEEVIGGFLKWYRLGDGSVHNKLKCIRFHTSSRSLVNGVTFLLLRLGIMPRVYKYPPRRMNHHTRYEIRVGGREDVIKLAGITGDFSNINLEKCTSLSGDRLFGVGDLIKNNVDRLKLNDDAYKKFDWYGFPKRKFTSRITLVNSCILLSKFGELDSALKVICDYDIAWDRIVSIENVKQPPYTIDLAVPSVQNFVGGNGLLILHNSDAVIEDLELILNSSREQLHINANKMGSVAGKVVVKDRGDTINWAKMGSGGWSIPSNVEDIKFLKVNAKYIIYMEKAAVWERLHEDKFWEKQNCIIMSSQGQTTRGIRRLLQRMYEEYKLPVYVLADWDVYGAYIYSVIKYGSINLAYASKRLTIPSVKYLGITHQDIEKYGLQKHLIKMKDTDRARIKQVSNYDWFKNNKEWQNQFAAMKKLDSKAEIQALSARGISFISEKYLPEKIKNQDFID